MRGQTRRRGSRVRHGHGQGTSGERETERDKGTERQRDVAASWEIA